MDILPRDNTAAHAQPSERGNADAMRVSLISAFASPKATAPAHWPHGGVATGAIAGEERALVDWASVVSAAFACNPANTDKKPKCWAGQQADGGAGIPSAHGGVSLNPKNHTQNNNPQHHFHEASDDSGDVFHERDSSAHAVVGYISRSYTHVKRGRHRR